MHVLLKKFSINLAPFDFLLRFNSNYHLLNILFDSLLLMHVNHLIVYGILILKERRNKIEARYPLNRMSFIIEIKNMIENFCDLVVLFI